MSLGSASNKYLSKLIETGADAMTNLYYVEFDGTLLRSIYNDLPIGLKVRNKDFTPPVFSQKTDNTVNYMTVDATLPIAAVTGTKELNFTFRLDENYRLYEYLLRQQAVTGSGNLGWSTNAVPDSNNGGFKVTVYAFNRALAKDSTSFADPEDEECYQKMYSFEHCWIKKITGLDYSYENQTPISLSVTVGFFEFEDPMNLLVSGE